MKLNASMIKQLEGEIGLYKSESMKQRKIVYHLEKERERFGAEASDANAKYLAALEEARAKPKRRARAPRPLAPRRAARQPPR